MIFDDIKRELTDREALALTVYGEARGERIEGQVAVINVVKNRAKIRNLSIKEVCFQPKQFSCWNDNDPQSPMLKEMARKIIADSNLIEDDPALRQIFYLLDGVLDDKLGDNTRGADHYMTVSLFNSAKRPFWAKTPKATITIGNHIFMQV